jgi:hypothetical protein
MQLINQQKSYYWQVFMSVAASVFGVQSDKNYRRDFKQQSFIPYIFVGVIFVVCLVLFLVVIVNLVV